MKQKTVVILAVKEYYATFTEWAHVKWYASVEPRTPQVMWKAGSNPQCGWTIDGRHYGPVTSEQIVHYFAGMTAKLRDKIERGSEPIKPRPSEVNGNDLPSPRPDEDRPGAR